MSRRNRTWRRGLLASALILALATAGCAGWSRHGIDPTPPRRIRLAVLPVDLAVPVRKLKSIETVPGPEPGPADEAAQVRRRMDAVASDLRVELEDRLVTSYLFEVVPSSAVDAALAELKTSTAPIAPGLVARRAGADAALTVRLSGYGAVKRSWLFWIAGTAAAEGVTQGVAVGLVAGPAAGAAIAGEEAVQEMLTSGGGIFVFDRFFTPVILEARLVSASDGVVFWKGTAMAVRDRKALKKIPAERRRLKQVRLALAARSAIAELSRKMEDKAFMNLDRQRRKAPADRTPVPEAAP